MLCTYVLKSIMYNLHNSTPYIELSVQIKHPAIKITFENIIAVPYFKIFFLNT